MFGFEQKEETLLENEKLKELYTNKNYQPPEKGKLETIYEEKSNLKEGVKSRRIANPGSFNLGKNLAERSINVEYKFWKQDDVMRNKRRKVMVTKLWKGRKKPKVIPLSKKAEKFLQEMIDTSVMSNEEDETSSNDSCSIPTVFHDECRTDNPACSESTSWSDISEFSEAAENAMVNDINSNCEIVDSVPLANERRKRGRPKKSLALSSVCLKSKNEPEVTPETISNPKSSCVKIGKGTKKVKFSSPADDSIISRTPLRPILDSNSLLIEKSSENFVDQTPKSTPSKDLLRSPDSGFREPEVHDKENLPSSVDEMASLINFVPEDELKALFDNDDLWFCKDSPKSTSTNERQVKRKSERRSIRRSARIQGTPGTTGSLFIDDSNEASINPEIVSPKDRDSSCVLNSPLPDSSAGEPLLTTLPVISKSSVDDSGSPIDGRTEVPIVHQTGEIRRLSLNEMSNTSERRNSSSYLGSSRSGLDISFPEVARRSLSGCEVSSSSLNEMRKKSFGLSDCEDEELISGIYGTKTLQPKKKKNRRQLETAFFDA